VSDRWTLKNMFYKDPSHKFIHKNGHFQQERSSLEKNEHISQTRETTISKECASPTTREIAWSKVQSCKNAKLQDAKP
jgi:hypothetical protein